MIDHFWHRSVIRDVAPERLFPHMWKQVALSSQHILTLEKERETERQTERERENSSSVFNAKNSELEIIFSKTDWSPCMHLKLIV